MSDVILRRTVTQILIAASSNYLDQTKKIGYTPLSWQYECNYNMPSNFNPLRKGKQQQKLPQYRYRQPQRQTNENSTKRRAIIRMSFVAIVCMLLLHQLYLMVDAIVGPADSTVTSNHSSNKQDASSTISVDANTQAEISTAMKAKIQPMSQTKIPKIVHFVYGMKDENPQLDLIQYLSIKSAQEIINPEKIYLHYHYLPTGEWFDLIRPLLTLRQVDIPTKIFGNLVDHYAHRADVVRLEALKEFGGIYLDLDVIMMKSIDHLLDEEFAMGQEGIGEFLHAHLTRYCKIITFLFRGLVWLVQRRFVIACKCTILTTMVRNI